LKPILAEVNHLTLKPVDKTTPTSHGFAP